MEEAIARHAAGLQVLAVRSGEEAIRLVEAADADEAVPCPALFLLDLNLPTKPGEEVLAHIRRSKRCGHLPVVVVTSSDSPEDREQALRLGANRYFRKPCDYDDFLHLGEIVKELLTRP